MKSAVKITANPTTGEVFTKNENLGKDGRQYGFIRLEQKIIDFNGSLGRFKTLSALKSISEDDFIKGKNYLKNGTELPGKIVREETTIQEIGFSPKMSSGKEDAQPCLKDGQQIYQRTYYTEDIDITDTLVPHNNVITGSTVTTKAEALNQN